MNQFFRHLSTYFIDYVHNNDIKKNQSSDQFIILLNLKDNSLFQKKINRKRLMLIML